MLEVGGRGLCGVVRMGVIEADDFHSAFARFTLHSHQLSGINFEPFVKFADSNVLTGDDGVYVPCGIVSLSHQNAAAFFGVGFFGVLPQCLVVGSGDVKAQVICSGIKS